jgi:hypothetical protein
VLQRTKRQTRDGVFTRATLRAERAELVRGETPGVSNSALFGPHNRAESRRGVHRSTFSAGPKPPMREQASNACGEAERLVQPAVPARRSLDGGGMFNVTVIVSRIPCWPLSLLIPIALAFGCSRRSPTESNGVVHARASLLTTATANLRVGVSVHRNDHTESLVRQFLSACGSPSTDAALNLPGGEYIVVLNIFMCDGTTFTTIPVVGFVDVDDRRIFSATASCPFVAHPGGDVLVVFDIR